MSTKITLPLKLSPSLANPSLDSFIAEQFDAAAPPDSIQCAGFA
jgi:hypothetical protein